MKTFSFQTHFKMETLLFINHLQSKVFLKRK